MNAKSLLSLFVVALGACRSSSPVAPALPLDPYATVHIINQTGVEINAWTIVIGIDANHTGLAFQNSAPSGSTDRCMESGSSTGERRFVEAAITPGSRLDSLFRVLSISDARREAFADSLARGTLTSAALLAKYPGLVTATAPFDPAPPGYAPSDTVRWKWTATAAIPSVIVVDAADRACAR